MVNRQLKTKNLFQNNKTIKVILRNKMKNQIFLNVPRAKRRKKMIRVIHKESKNCRQVENVLINFAPQKKFTKRFVRGYKTINTVSFVKIVMKITTTIFTVNFVSKFTRIIVKIKTMTNGLDAIIAKDGYG